MKQSFRNKTVFYIFLILVFFSSGSVFAYQKSKIDITPQNDFVVEPGKTEIFLNPGESTVKNITITNRIDRNVNFKLTTEDIIGTDNPLEQIVLLGDEASPYSLKDLIKPEINEFSLALGEKIVIPVSISVPVDAEPRGYYGALIVSNDPEKVATSNTTEAESKTRIVSRIGSLFLVKINGQGKEEGALDSFGLIGPKKSFYEKRPTGFSIGFKNTGNVHLVPYGEVTIKNMLGRTVGQIPVDAYFALPDSIRYREVVWTEGFGLGHYTAHLSLYKGYGNEYDESKIGFWVLPWKVLLSILGVLVVLVSLIYYISTRFELRKKK